MKYIETDNKFNRYCVTTALPYANGPVHIGHLAGVYVPADIYVRYLRMMNEDASTKSGSQPPTTNASSTTTSKTISPATWIPQITSARSACR